ncbi:MAG: aspartate-semialdehyde dehydrogenase [Candidatus Rokubacteria bacterium RIFCSPLOWO2_12_FULL_71_22]|nr:MAG: aspartate-semialdehyde dehydrogenase [Candidatus Rokubacteria bacterium RIFCSPLOWO2_02_FULL_72_37]OGL20147.1 MAG: aspartate-semialdehyde dehydrogenase [Candidatus Rokubacteria bacterium RIFCSPLOWO2_12_FULL_71_22]
MAAGLTVAVVGATGAAGQTTLKILEERKFPVRELRCFASERSIGKTVTFRGESLPIRRIEPPAFAGVDVAFCSAGSAQSKEYAPMIVKAGATVIDKSNAFRMDPAVPLVVPEINPHAARQHQGILACPNCTTIVTVMPLKPLHDAGRLTRVIATSYQAVSGAGVNGIAELREQTLAWARGEALVPRHFPHQIAFNLIPHIDKFGADGYTAEEMKLVNETRKILEAPDLKITPTTVRVPVFTCHSIAVTAETERKIGAARARELFAAFPGLRLWDAPAENRYPMPITVEGQDDCFVGRVREDLSSPSGVTFWVVGDQLRKGAATNAVQIAELLFC